MAIWLWQRPAGVAARACEKRGKEPPAAGGMIPPDLCNGKRGRWSCGGGRGQEKKLRILILILIFNSSRNDPNTPASSGVKGGRRNQWRLDAAARPDTSKQASRPGYSPASHRSHPTRPPQPSNPTTATGTPPRFRSFVLGGVSVKKGH